MLKTTKQAQLAKEFRRYNLQILGLSEIRLADSGERRCSTGEYLLYSGRPQNEIRSCGVGFMLSKSAHDSLIDWHPVSERIIIARFKTTSKNMTFIQVYAPTEVGSVEDKEEFYGKLAYTLRNKVDKSDIVMLIGDLNAKVGDSNEGWETTMGKFGIGTMNDNGERFAEFCAEHKLMIGGTLFPHRNIHKVTWTSPDGRTQNQIDHITISKKWRTALLDVRNYRGADVFSDHHLLVGSLRVKFTKIRRPYVAAKKKFNLDKLKSEPTVREFKIKLRDKLENQQQHLDNAEHWKVITDALKQTAENTLGFRNFQRKEWISDATWDIIEERRMLKNKINNSTGQEQTSLRVMYKELDRKVSRSARADKRRYLDGIATEAQRAAESNNMRETYRLAKKLTNSNSKTDYLLRSSDGELLTTEEQQSERWSEYFEDLLNQPEQNVPVSPINSNTRTQTGFNSNPPSMNEVKAAAKQLKSGKAPGNDEIPSELLKVSMEVDSFASQLHSLINHVWQTEDVPTEWIDGLIIKLPKKGDLSKCNNWRGITLLNTVNKLITIIVHNRISKVMDKKLRNQQAGFRPGRSCIDHINTLRIIIEQSVEFNSPLYLLFIDFERAFDSLNRDVMWTILASYGIPQKLINIIKSLYRDTRCQVIHRGKPGRQFRIKSGVKQGCILSPLLFIIVLDWVMKKTNVVARGIQWNMTDRLEDIDFADDICELTHRFQDMEDKLETLILYAGQVGLKINVQKTKLMRINAETTRSLTIGNEEIGEVDSFCYLGSKITDDGGADADAQNRIGKARGSFEMLRNIWNSTQISRNLKLRIFKSNVLSVLLYGCETWKITESITSSIQVFVNKCLRRILMIRWPNVISNEELWRRTNMEKLDIQIKRRKWNWIGHTLRKPADDVARAALDWNPQGKRKIGRPKTTWRRSVIAEAETNGKSWNEIKILAKNRVRWRNFVDYLCSPAEF